MTVVIITNGAAELAVNVLGQHPPQALFLHSGVGDRREWGNVLASLGTRAQSITFDRRGHGVTSYQAEEDWSPVADAVAVLDGCRVGSAAVVGASQGGRIAIDLALRHPDRVQRLALIAPAVSGAPSSEFDAPVRELDRLMDQAYEAKDWDSLNRMEAHIWLDGALQLPGRVTGPARDLFLDMNGIAIAADDTGTESEPPSAWARLDQLTAETLILIGEHDLRHIRDNARHLAATIPRARLVELPGVAHLPHLEGNQQALEAVVEFVLTT